MGNRQHLLSLIEQYKNHFPEEGVMSARLESFVQENSNCFERQLLKGHITGSAWVVDEDSEQTLLTHHGKLDKWLQPGGHADGDHEIARVAMREAKEETGLGQLFLVSDHLFDIDIHTIPERGAEPEHLHYDCRFLIRCIGDKTYRVSDESHDLAWIPLSEVESLTREKSVLRMVEKTGKIKRGFLRDF